MSPTELSEKSTDRRWSSRLYFLFAAVGYAVGLGNVWRFPYLVGQHGGSVFVLLYLGLVTVIAIPILIAELMVGRRGRGSAPVAMRTVASEGGRSERWALVGWLGLTATFLILTFFSVITGWALAYLFKAATGALSDLDAASATATFDNLMTDPATMMAWSAVILVLCTFIVVRDLHEGLEKAMGILVPLLPVLLLVLVVHSALTGDFSAATDFLFRFDPSSLNGEAALAALGQVFLSVGVGGAVWMTFGSYLPKSASLPGAACRIVAADTVVALLAGLAIFPVVFAHGLDPSSGPGLIFITYPLALSGSPASALFSSALFLLLVVIALTSIIGALEALTSAAVERLGLGRTATGVGIGIATWTLGLATVLSFNRWSGLRLPARFGRIGGKPPFEQLDYATLHIMVPVSALLVTIFVAWRIAPAISESELGLKSSVAYQGWLWMLRVAVPLALLSILVL